MTLNVNKEKLTILDVQFDNYEDFDAVWYAVGSSMIEDFTPTTESVLELKLCYKQKEGTTNWLRTNTKESIIKNLAKILDCLNFFHPFREGNGRTQREVIRVLALSKGYKAQIRVSEDDTVYNTYMDGTVHGDLQKLELLFEKILEKI